MKSSNKKKYKYTHLGKQKSIDYQKSFEGKKKRNRLIWEIEKDILRSIIFDRQIKRNKYLDFACGTGRLLSFLEKYLTVPLGLINRIER